MECNQLMEPNPTFLKSSLECWQYIGLTYELNTSQEKTSFLFQWMTNHLPTRRNIKGRFIYNTYNYLNVGYWFVRFRGHRISAKRQIRNMWLLIILLEPNNNYTEDWSHAITDDDDDGVMCINLSFYWCKDDEM